MGNETTVKMISGAEITTPSQRKRGIHVIVGYCSARQVLDAGEERNVRRALQKNTGVHDEIRDTIINRPEQFSELNSGFTLVAESFKCNKDTKTYTFKNLQLVNGCQTKWCLLDELTKEGCDNLNIDLQVEIIVTTDEDYMQEISIARNYQNLVRAISIDGARGILKALNEFFMSSTFGQPIRTDESQSSKDVLDTFKIIQVALMMMDTQFAAKYWKAEDIDKFFKDPRKVYGQKAWCLRQYTKFFNDAYPKDEKGNDLPVNAKKAEFFYAFNIFAVQSFKIYRELTGVTPRSSYNKDIFESLRDYQDKTLKNPTTLKPIHKEIVDGFAFPVLYSIRPFVSIKRLRENDFLITIDTASFNNPLSENAKMAMKQYITTFKRIFKAYGDIPDQIANKNGNAPYDSLYGAAQDIRLAILNDREAMVSEKVSA